MDRGRKPDLAADPAAEPDADPDPDLGLGVDADVVVVRACLRGGSGGSPTAVVVERAEGDRHRTDAGDGIGTGTGAGTAAAGGVFGHDGGDEVRDRYRRRVPVVHGTSHAVFVRRERDGVVGLRFFTSAGELPACGHGTVAALAVLASREGPCRVRLRTGRRVFAGRAEPAAGAEGRFTAVFDPGPVVLRAPTAEERRLVLPALGLAPGGTGPDVRVAGVGRERLLVPVPSRAALAALAPDLDRLRAACDRLGLLGAYVHSAPTAGGALAARMFAPSIGVPEDIANANSTACLAARLAQAGIASITVDMGDSLGSPATITAATRPDGTVELGGTVALPT
ncbi:PhzF family phenazine biosynthesis protein [Streptomyces roseicoloratus]|uniref:PhzF family phenazine biosynthesis protein n=1 Tax=Streptomyces roseicoloratus TaxID=2508722 RepID=UPI001FE37D9F|nr:PhzF family phenazine biosynthesis protein [Streptomyces roseicoloratus]